MRANRNARKMRALRRRRREAFGAFIRDLVDHLRAHGEVITSAKLRERLGDA